MAKKMDRKNVPSRDYTSDLPAMPKKHPVKPGLSKMHVPADLRALGITSMKEFVHG